MSLFINTCIVVKILIRIRLQNIYNNCIVHTLMLYINIYYIIYVTIL